MNAAGALDLARRAGLRIAFNGANLVLDGPAAPSPEVVEALRAHKAEIVQLLAAERCRYCRGPATLDDQLLDCAYAGHPMQLHRGCISPFVASEDSPRYAPPPKPAACDHCGRPGGKLEMVSVPSGPLHGIPVHRHCVADWYARPSTPEREP